MDRKTLEYMEERTKKARQIVYRIEKLNKNLETIVFTDYVFFNTKTGGNYVEEKEYSLVKKMKQSFKEIVAEEIQRLEKELAEL
jgi:hypothetical protein